MAGLSRACARLTLGRPSPVPLAVLGLPRSRRLHEAIPAAAEAAAPLVGAGMAHFLSLSPPLAAQVLFLSPMQAIRQFRTDGTTGSVSSLPYAAMAANGVAWTAYGALGSDPTIMLANMPPALLGVYYCSVFYKYRADGAVALPYFAGAAAFSTAVAVAAITLPAATAKMAIGYGGVAVCTIMFGGPLASIKDVLRERSAHSLPLAYTLAGVANCTLWTSYGGLVIHDPLIWAPNALGLAFSLGQLGLIARFGTTKPNSPVAAATGAGSGPMASGLGHAAVDAAESAARETVTASKVAKEAAEQAAKQTAAATEKAADAVSAQAKKYK